MRGSAVRVPRKTEEINGGDKVQCNKFVRTRRINVPAIALHFRVLARPPVRRARWRLQERKSHAGSKAILMRGLRRARGRPSRSVGNQDYKTANYKAKGLNEPRPPPPGQPRTHGKAPPRPLSPVASPYMKDGIGEHTSGAFPDPPRPIGSLPRKPCPDGANFLGATVTRDGL
ncbi:hypothetical protein SKAU_G00290650 [Synaphobranchus kaupii]|uniref:Uncharacterized protein n=1 Tax=Synaphobranchus kaupii TaxID=118154 RepID=A0A9Q1ETM5_SYNKA|nr:hypothetical protein SKAU_G00290650 [Synaphobranchus kaupii]